MKLMKTDRYHQDPFALRKTIISFFVSVIACTGFLFGVQTLEKSFAINPVLVTERTAGQVLDRPNLGPRSITPAPESLCVSPEMEWAHDGGCCVETVPVIPDTVKQKQKIPYQGIIIRVAGRYQVDPHLIQAIIFAESGYNPRAKSKKGAGGLMQLMPATAKALGIRDVYDPMQNIDGGVRYFRSLLDRFDGDVQLALAAYNAGSRHVRNYDGVPPFKATRHYIKKVLNFQKKFKIDFIPF